MKRVLPLLLALAVLLLLVSAPAAAADRIILLTDRENVPGGGDGSLARVPAERGEAPGEGEPEVPAFPDVVGHWGESYINKAAAMGLFSGFEDGTFRPDEAVSRGQFVTVLWRLAGKPAAGESLPFTDVPEGHWFSEAIAWACARGLVNGRSEETFDPGGSITRQEAMKVLFCFAGGVSGMETLFTSIYDSEFADSGEIADWAKPAMYWGYYNGIINGRNTGETLCPAETATRAELAKILVVFSEKFAA